MVDDVDESATNIFKNLMTAIKKPGLSLKDFTSIGADNTNVKLGNTRCFCIVS